MADATSTEPGAPVKSVTELPPAEEKSIAREAQRRAPKATSLLATPDRIILRMNKLLANPGGLASFLSTFNYTLYLLAHIQIKSMPLRARLAQLLGRPPPVPGVPSTAALGALLSQTRTTLRLFGLFPMYAWFRSLMQGPKPGQDLVLYTTAVTQCTLYMTYQFLENVAVLTDNKVLPTSYTTRWTASAGGKTTKIYIWAYRMWLAGIACDFVRLAREAQLENNRRAKRVVSQQGASWKEDQETDAKWWRQAVIPVAWLPVALHSSVEGGLSWVSLGLMGACGLAASAGRTSELWASTAEV